MKKRILTVILSIVLVFSTLSLVGCKKEDENTINILLMANSSENKFYEAHFNKIEEETGYTINYTGIAFANYYDKLKAEINGDNAPDIIYVRPSDMRSFISEGLIASLESEVNAQKAVDMSKIFSSALTSYKYDKASKKLGSGELYAIPKDLSVQQLGYNKTLIERNQQKIKAAGIEKLPWEMDFSKENYTWDEYKTMAKLCMNTSDKNNPIYGSDMPNIEILTWAFGGTVISEDMQTLNYNSDAVKKAVKYQADLIKEGAASYEGATYDNFVSGKVAFYGETNSFNLKDYDETFKALNMEWDIMPWPVVDNSTTAKATAWTGKIGSAGYAVSSGSNVKDKAVEVVLTLLSEKTQDSLVATEKLMLPLYQSVAEEAYISEEYDDVYVPKNRKIFIDVISGDNGKFSDDFRCYDLAWQKTFLDYLETIFTAQPSDVYGLIKTDSQYNDINRSMQEIYDRNKNK